MTNKPNFEELDKLLKELQGCLKSLLMDWAISLLCLGHLFIILPLLTPEKHFWVNLGCNLLIFEGCFVTFTSIKRKKLTLTSGLFYLTRTFFTSSLYLYQYVKINLLTFVLRRLK